MSNLIKSVGQIDAKLNRAGIQFLADEHAAAILSHPGYDLCRVYAEMKRYEAYLKMVLLHLKPVIYRRLRDTPRQRLDYGTAKVSFTRRTKYDYSADPLWSEIDELLENAKLARKDREEFLQSLQAPTQQEINEATGEVITAHAPKVRYLDTLSVRFTRAS